MPESLLVAPRHQPGAGRRADTTAHVGLAESHALPRDRVDPRREPSRARVGLGLEAEVGPPRVVGVEDDDVGPTALATRELPRPPGRTALPRARQEREQADEGRASQASWNGDGRPDPARGDAADPAAAPAVSASDGAECELRELPVADRVPRAAPLPETRSSSMFAPLAPLSLGSAADPRASPFSPRRTRPRRTRRAGARDHLRARPLPGRLRPDRRPLGPAQALEAAGPGRRSPRAAPPSHRPGRRPRPRAREEPRRCSSANATDHGTAWSIAQALRLRDHVHHGTI